MKVASNEKDLQSEDKTTQQKPTKKKRSAVSYAVSFFAKLAVTALVVFVLLRFVGGVYVCHTNSNYPMIKDGDLCVIYRLDEPAQGDMLVYMADGKIRFVRVIAVERQVVNIENGSVTVDGNTLYNDSVYPSETPDNGSLEYPYTVPDGCVYLLNDYRTDISDSRVYAAISEEDCLGKVIFMLRRRGI